MISEDLALIHRCSTTVKLLATSESATLPKDRYTKEDHEYKDRLAHQLIARTSIAFHLTVDFGVHCASPVTSN